MIRPTARQIIGTYNEMSSKDNADSHISGTGATAFSQKYNVNISAEAILNNIIEEAWKKDENVDSFYVNKYFTTKAAILCDGIAKRKPFPRNNIRVAIASMLTILKLNNINVEYDDSDIIRLSNILEQGEDVSFVVDWISKRTSYMYC